MNRILSEEELDRRLASLPREISPSRDVWPGISARIGRGEPTAAGRRQAPGFWAVAAAASVLVAFAAGLILSRTAPPSHPAPEQWAPGGEFVFDAGEKPSIPSIRLSEREYNAAFKEFMALDAMAGYARDNGPTPMGEGWEAMRKTEQALAEALNQEPDNLFLNQRLAVLRARQIELLQRIAALEMSSRSSTI